MSTLPPFDPDTRIKTDLKTIGSAVAFIAIAVFGYAGLKNEVETLKKTAESQAAAITEVQSALRSLEIQGAGQTEILKYLARDRRGPVPEAAK